MYQLSLSKLKSAMDGRSACKLATESGLSPFTLYNLLEGKSDPKNIKLSTAISLAHTLDVSIDSLLERSGE